MKNTEPHWYIRTPNGVVYGPAVREQLQFWRNEGRLQADSEVSSTFPYQWTKANLAFPEFFTSSIPPINSQAMTPHRGVGLVILASLGFLCG